MKNKEKIDTDDQPGDSTGVLEKEQRKYKYQNNNA